MIGIAIKNQKSCVIFYLSSRLNFRKGIAQEITDRIIFHLCARMIIYFFVIYSFVSVNLYIYIYRKDLLILAFSDTNVY